LVPLNNFSVGQRPLLVIDALTFVCFEVEADEITDRMANPETLREEMVKRIVDADRSTSIICCFAFKCEPGFASKIDPPRTPDYGVDFDFLLRAFS